MADRENESPPTCDNAEPVDAATKIVSKVIHEYDVIESSEPVQDHVAKEHLNILYDNQDVKQTATEVKEDSGTGDSPDTGNMPEKVPSKPGKATDMNIHRHRMSSSDRSSVSVDEPLYELPKVNCKEKIIICLDVSSDMEQLTFRSRSGDKFSAQRIARRALGFFLQSKERLDKRHEYALVLLQEAAIWAKDFTNNVKDVLNLLDDIAEMSQSCESFEMSSLYDKICDKVDLPRVEEDVKQIPPPYTVRVIFIYGRSSSPIQIKSEESMKLLNSSPYFFFDALYMHEPLSEENKCQEIFDSICDLDRKGLSYMLAASRNPTKLYDHMAKLIAHPLQRPHQGDTAYRIGSSIPDDE